MSNSRRAELTAFSHIFVKLEKLDELEKKIITLEKKIKSQDKKLRSLTVDG